MKPAIVTYLLDKYCSYKTYAGLSIYVHKNILCREQYKIRVESYLNTLLHIGM